MTNASFRSPLILLTASTGTYLAHKILAITKKLEEDRYNHVGVSINRDDKIFQWFFQQSNDDTW